MHRVICLSSARYLVWKVLVCRFAFVLLQFRCPTPEAKCGRPRVRYSIASEIECGRRSCLHFIESLLERFVLQVRRCSRGGAKPSRLQRLALPCRLFLLVGKREGVPSTCGSWWRWQTTVATADDNGDGNGRAFSRTAEAATMKTSEINEFIYRF